MFNFNMDYVKVRELIEAAVQRSSLWFSKSDVSFELTVEQELHDECLHADRQRLVQVLVTVLLTARKWAGTKGTVNLTVCLSPGEVDVTAPGGGRPAGKDDVTHAPGRAMVVTIHHTGRQRSAPTLARLFTPFFAIDTLATDTTTLAGDVRLMDGARAFPASDVCPLLPLYGLAFPLLTRTAARLKRCSILRWGLGWNSPSAVHSLTAMVVPSKRLVRTWESRAAPSSSSRFP